VALVGAPWFANRVEPYVLGMPFLLAWIAGWVTMASVVMAIISVFDRARHLYDTESPPEAPRRAEHRSAASDVPSRP
jgi:hypothetical protein